MPRSRAGAHEGAASLLRALHHGPGAFVLPNAWDVASGVLLADAGFPVVGTTSLGVTAAAGLPDGAAAGVEFTVALARALVERLAVPVTVDLEGGYSQDPARVAALAAQLAELGVAGVNLEDGRAAGSCVPPPNMPRSSVPSRVLHRDCSSMPAPTPTGCRSVARMTGSPRRRRG